MTVESRRHWLL